MKLLTLPLAVRRRLIEHEADILAPALEQRTKTFSAPCSRCGGAMHQKLAERTFTECRYGQRQSSERSHCSSVSAIDQMNPHPDSRPVATAFPLCHEAMGENGSPDFWSATASAKNRNVIRDIFCL